MINVQGLMELKRFFPNSGRTVLREGMGYSKNTNYKKAHFLVRNTFLSFNYFDFFLIFKTCVQCALSGEKRLQCQSLFLTHSACLRFGHLFDSQKENNHESKETGG